MRTRDDEKKEALFEATVKLVNEIGFASSSVAKIAKEANISPATLYIYHKNKEDLLVSTYIDIKIDISKAIWRDLDPSQPIRDIFRHFWFSMFEYARNNMRYFRYVEQFSNSPFSSLVSEEDTAKYFVPLADALQKGIEQKIIKNIDGDIFKAFMWYPITVLTNPRLCPDFELSEENIETAFTAAWDAIKL
jgi:AcrR family transcriptional regulator